MTRTLLHLHSHDWINAPKNTPFLLLVSTLSLALGLFSACDRSDTVTESSSGTPELQFNSKMAFSKGGNADAYKVGGWSQTEEKFTWLEGTSARLRVQLPSAKETVTLKARLAALTKTPELPAQPVEVYINDTKIAEWQVAETSEFTVALPNEITKSGGVLTIEFKMPKATSPKTLGLSSDSRILGICFHDLEFSKSLTQVAAGSIQLRPRWGAATLARRMLSADG